MIGGSLAGITGVLTLIVFGYSLLTPWLLASIVPYVVIVGTGILFWGRVGRAIDQATEVGDEARVSALLRSSRNVAISRAENVLFVALITLMVARPSF